MTEASLQEEYFSDNEEVDVNKHESLLDALDEMDGRKRQVELRSEAYGVSEYHVPSVKDEVRLHDLVGALKESSSHGTLKKQLKRVRNDKVLPVPLPKHEQAEIHRNLAYDNTTKDLSKWDSVVHSNRNAEQLQFPLKRADLKLLTSPSDFVKRAQPKTSLELEVAALLRGSDHNLDEDKFLTPAEERALKAMSVEEAKERRAELQKYRALLSYKEAKARRQKKIKSKKFHKILQKEKKKKDKKALDEMEKNDPEAYLEKLKRLDEDRIQERISLKHRGGSKFAQKQTLYKKYDGQARDALQDMLQKSRELTKKVALESDSDEEAVEDNDTDTANDIAKAMLGSSGKAAATSNPWMTSGIKVPKKFLKPEAIQNEDSEDDAENEDSEEDMSDVNSDQDVCDKGHMSAGGKIDIDTLFDELEEHELGTVRQRRKQEKHVGKEKDKDKSLSKNQIAQEASSDEEEVELLASGSEQDEEEAVHKNSRQKLNSSKQSATSKCELIEESSKSSLSMSLKRKKAMEDFEIDSDSEIEDETPEQRSSSADIEDTHRQSNVKSRSQDTTPAEAIVDPNNFITVGDRSAKILVADAESDDEDDSDEDDMRQTMTIAEAFAEDDVVEEFRQEKEDTRQRDKPKDIDLTLPGWGDWGGQGLKPSKKKRQRFLIKAPPAPPRKDRNLDNVIISEVKDTAVSKHQVRQLPFPFTNPNQFESSIRQPIGKTWNPETAYKKLIKPQKVTRMGTVIEPINKDDVLKKKTDDLVPDKEKKPRKKRKNAGAKKDKE